jgi:predicted PurR-regulated permease PerM
MNQKIEISHRTIIFTLILLACIWLILEIREIIYLLFISFIVMSALRPMVRYLEGHKIPKIISILFIYALVIGILAFTVSSLVPALASQISRFIADFPKYVEMVKPYYKVDVQQLAQQIAPFGENVLNFTVSLFSNIVTLATVLVVTFYLLLEHDHIRMYLDDLLPQEKVAKTLRTINNVEISLGAWLRGEIILMFCIGLMAFIGLSILRIDYALPLAMFAGLMEIIPVIGPIISGVPAVLVALTISPILALATIAIYFLIHQLENSVIFPMVMKRAVDLSPLITIVALMVGSKLAGIAGAILSIPVVLTTRSVILAILDKDVKAG